MLSALGPPRFITHVRLQTMTSQAPQSTGRPPTLWNPNAAACWSLLFSPAFGALLHARNADVLGRTDEAKANRVWFWISIGYFAAAFVTTFIPAIPDGIFRFSAIGLL